MSRFDRRAELPEFEEEAQPAKMPKAKRKKAGLHISPLNTHVNSRSGSEARRNDPEDEPTDSRSASGSAGRGSASRDITPNTHYSHSGSLSALPEVSERERKKLAKEEEMFRRQEQERNGIKGKKKRNSGGSTVNTPNTTSSKHLDFGGSSKYTDAGTSKQTGLPSAKPGRRPKNSNAPKTSPRTITRIVKRPKPDYVDSEVQCDLDKEEAEKRIQASPPRRPFLSTTQRLLQRCALNNARRKGPAAVAEAVKMMNIDDKMDIDHSSGIQSHISKSTIPEEPETITRPHPSKEAEMRDADSDEQHLPSVSGEADVKQEHSSTPVSPDVSSHLTIDPPAPPWPSQAAHSTQEGPPVPAIHQNPTEMHIEMPPPSANPFSAAATLSATSPNSVTGAITQSPVTLMGPTPIFSPAVTAAVTPSPARKKMSLSDYTKAKKAKDKERESSPASTTSGPVGVALNASASDVARAMEGSALEDDVKMEDVSDNPPAAANPA